MSKKSFRIQGHVLPKYSKKEIGDGRIIGYLDNKFSSDCIDVKAWSVEDTVILKVHTEKPKFSRVVCFVRTGEREYAACVKDLRIAIMIALVAIFIAVSVFLFGSGEDSSSIPIALQDLASHGIGNNQSSTSGEFDVTLYSVGTITKDNRLIPFGNSENNKLLCKYTFYDEDHNELESTDYIRPSSGEYYYFDAYKYFDNGSHTLYFTMQTLDEETGNPDTSANLSMKLEVEK